MMNGMNEKKADAISKLAAGAVTAGVMFAVSQEELLPTLITYGGPEVIAEEIADLVTPRIQALLGAKGDVNMLVRPAIVGGTVFGMFSVAAVGGRASLTVAAAAAAGCVAGSYLYEYLLKQTVQAQ